MKSWVLVAVAVLVASGASAQAQAPAHPIFTRKATAAAVAQMGATATASQDPRHDWSRLRQLTPSPLSWRPAFGVDPGGVGALADLGQSTALF